VARHERPAPDRAETPERWALDAGAADVATLDIPASAQRERVFEIDLRFVVRAPASRAPAWHAMSVDLNGVREWARRIDTHDAVHGVGQTDSLDYHCRVVLPVGRALRVRAVTQVGGAQRVRLVIEAEEAPDR
jgi:hypothetical protein